jgi:hypothetical protein
MQEKLNEIHNKYQSLDRAEIIKSGDSTNLTDIQSEVDKIYEWENDYFESEDYRNQLPEPSRKDIENEFENASNMFSQIVTMRGSDIAQFAQHKASFIETIRNYYRSLYNNFVKDFRGWKLDHYQADRLKELDAIFADAKKRQKNIKEKEAEVEQRASDTAELTQDIGLSQLAKYFYQLYSGDNEWIIDENKKWAKRSWHSLLRFFRGYRGASRLWMLFSLVAFGVAFYVADSQLLPFVKELTTVKADGSSNVNASLVYAVLIAKSLVLLVPVYAIRFCLKNYGSNKHLAADALHKAKTLQTLPTFLAIPRGDDAAIRDITTSVSQLVFTPAQSGFIAQKGDYEGSDITINTPQIKP